MAHTLVPAAPNFFVYVYGYKNSLTLVPSTEGFLKPGCYLHLMYSVGKLNPQVFFGTLGSRSATETSEPPETTMPEFRLTEILKRRRPK